MQQSLSQCYMLLFASDLQYHSLVHLREQFLYKSLYETELPSSGFKTSKWHFASSNTTCGSYIYHASFSVLFAWRSILLYENDHWDSIFICECTCTMRSCTIWRPSLIKTEGQFPLSPCCGGANTTLRGLITTPSHLFSQLWPPQTACQPDWLPVSWLVGFLLWCIRCNAVGLPCNEGGRPENGGNNKIGRDSDEALGCSIHCWQLHGYVVLSIFMCFFSLGSIGFKWLLHGQCLLLFRNVIAFYLDK